MKNNNTGVKQ